MRTPLMSICLVALACSVDAQISPCPVTVYDAVKDSRLHPLQRSRIVEVVPVPFPKLVASSDLIVEGIAQRLGTSVSKDGCYLYTDSVVTSRSVIAGNVRVPKEPGPSVIVRQWGGELMINGAKVTFRDGHLPLLESDQHVLLFLTGPNQDGVYQIVGDFAGAFGVANGVARAMTPDAEVVHGDFRQMSVADFIAEI